MVIEWDVLIAENATLAVMIFGAIYVESWTEKKRARQKSREDARLILGFVTNDLDKKLRFIEDTIQYKDYKPFFTDMWDSVILAGRQVVLPFPVFENLQHTYSWMKYYNSELEQRDKSDDLAGVLETLNEVKQSISQSTSLLANTKL